MTVNGVPRHFLNPVANKELHLHLYLEPPPVQASEFSREIKNLCISKRSFHDDGQEKKFTDRTPCTNMHPRILVHISL